ncbi:hypothetical protein CR513_37905, partial [Mucuna pruriens]
MSSLVILPQPSVVTQLAVNFAIRTSWVDGAKRTFGVRVVVKFGIRKSKNMHVGHTSDSVSFIPETDNFEIKPDFSNNPLYELDPMENNNNRTLKELAMPDRQKTGLYLQPVMFTTWEEIKRMFLEKFFPMSKTAAIRKEICGIRQHSGEMVHEYRERFNKLCATCSHHQINEHLLLQYFYEGLLMMERSMIDAASGGALMDKTLVVAQHLISNMVSNRK